MGDDGLGAPDAPGPDDDHDADLDAFARDAGAAARRLTALIAGATFLVLHAVVGYLTLSLGLVAPPWAVAALLAVWALVGVAAWRVRARRPILTMLVPFLTAGIALTVVWLGDVHLGWTA